MKSEARCRNCKTQADSEAYKKTKAAEAEAESNRKVAESVTDNLIRYEEAQARKSMDG